MEPFRLRRWRLPAIWAHLELYTCARPGRSRGSKGLVPERLVHDWTRGLPSQKGLAVVSLLGQKPDGRSEWSFYSFHKEGRSFQDWLDQHHAEKRIQVIERPTWDCRPVPVAVLIAVEADIRAYLHKSLTVIVMDSGGWARSAQVCTHIRAMAVDADA